MRAIRLRKENCGSRVGSSFNATVVFGLALNASASLIQSIPGESENHPIVTASHDKQDY